ncbi:hypothetical protein ACNPQR_18840, partial [Streptomyces sp. NPDC056264]
QCSGVPVRFLTTALLVLVNVLIGVVITSLEEAREMERDEPAEAADTTEIYTCIALTCADAAAQPPFLSRLLTKR